MTRGRIRRVAVLVLAVLAVEAAVCAAVGGVGGRLRLWVNVLTIQGIVLAIAGSFLLVDVPFAAARAVRQGGGGVSPERRGERRRWGMALLVFGSLLFGGAALIWSVGTGG